MSRVGILALAVVWGSVLGAARAEARTVEALQCQSKVWRAVAQVAPSCHGAGIGRICSGAALGKARNRTERILAKYQTAAPPAACVPVLCATSETPFVCADTLVSGNGAQRPETLDDWQPGDFRCLHRSARVLARLAKKSRRCDRDPAARAACLEQVVADHAAKLEQVVGTFIDAGASLRRCLFGSCRPDADVSPCVRDVVEDAADEPPPSGGPPDNPPPTDPGPTDPGDMTAQEIECRAVSPVVLAEYDERVAKCVEDSDDVPSCILQARVKREEKVAGLLDKRVRPEVCFPGICTPEQTPEQCAAAVFDLHTPGGGGTPGEPTDPEAAQLCRAVARTILDELADDLEACAAAHDAEPDIAACAQAAVDVHRPDLVSHLEEQLADGVPPDDCLPVLCADVTEPIACADAAIASLVDLPASSSSTTTTSSTSSTSVDG